ncbi:MAG: GHKL domain-containing protein [Muribaculaceae bacterium]|nr:GHKL domain-containing protein [Muribaculaceae bacterium]
MEVAEIYWQTVSYTADILDICITGYFLSRFVKPFLQGCKQIYRIGVAYGLVMLFLLCIPQEVSGSVASAIGVTAVFLTMCLLDKGKIEQKIFLTVICYLLDWSVWGMLVAVWNLLYAIAMRLPMIQASTKLQFAEYVVRQILWLIMRCLVMNLFIRLLHKAYGCKTENMTGKELILTLTPFGPLVLGRTVFRYFVNVYEMDMHQYVWHNHLGYHFLLFLYQSVSFAAMLTVILIYQSIKEGQRREKEDAVLARQLEEAKRHIAEVEKLYRDIRSLKHDMGNHIMVLEHLYGKAYHNAEAPSREAAEAEEYVAQWKRQIADTAPIGSVNSGNPVTDIILGEKAQEAADKKIDFQYDFHYPVETGLNAFDISVILGNALNNAIEAAQECENPYVHASSYRKNNAYMIEIRNSIAKVRPLDEESGLPITGKKEEGHGFGLINIRKIAQKYYGDIVIEQREGEFLLVVMVMM